MLIISAVQQLSVKANTYIWIAEKKIFYFGCFYYLMHWRVGTMSGMTVTPEITLRCIAETYP